MPVFLGLDIGSNSVGSAWVDTDHEIVDLGVTIFPAGVDETETKRGAPLNQKRRQKRQQRKGIARRARRKLRLRRWLTNHGFLPSDVTALRALLDSDPWHLRRRALTEAIEPHEFGRIILHLAQRRGAVGLQPVEMASASKVDDESADGKDGESADDAVLATARKHTRELMANYNAKSYGELICRLMNERQANPMDREGTAKADKTFQKLPVRNRHNLLVDKPEEAVYADRELIHEEFLLLWQCQKKLGGALAALLTDERLLDLDDPQLRRFDKAGDPKQQRKYRETWRHGGELFAQRRTYWDTGTLGRCELEPTDERCPLADMYAQEYRVIETVNNIRTRARGATEWAPLSPDDRNRVIDFLRGGTYVPASSGKSKKPLKPKAAPKNVEAKHIRELLGIDKKAMEKRNMPADFYELNLEQDADREINTDWFYREVVRGVFGEEAWKALEGRQREAVNAAILKFNPENPDHADRLSRGAIAWWRLDGAQVAKLFDVWQRRPKVEKRLKMSRRAIRNLLPYMNQFDVENNHWPTQNEARQDYSERPDAVDTMSGKPATVNQRARYSVTVTPELRDVLLSLLGNDKTRVDRVLANRGLTKPERQYVKKHPDLLPPAPVLSNPVVRKAIHEVRRHILTYIRKYRRKPDRIVIEMARSAKQPEKVRNRMLSLNRRRNKMRLQLIADLSLERLSLYQQNAKIDRALLAVQQNMACPYCDNKKLGAITPRRAAEGHDLELDHIVPRSWGGSDGLNNRVICHKGCNLGKSDKPPKASMTATDFELLEQRMARIKEEANRDRWNEHDYFTPKDYARKWDNLHCSERPKEAWSKSQLTDTAYAAREVGSYLRNALFSTEETGEQRIFFTKGSYTFLLRKDWRLFQLLKSPGEILDREGNAEAKKKLAEKDRGDHRHHAIDAVCIALTGPELLQNLARDASDIEAVKAEAEEKGQEAPLHKIRRKRIDPPWGTMTDFRKEVLAKVFGRFDKADERGHKSPGTEQGIPLIVSHRPVKRKLTGYLHKEDLWGAVDPSQNVFRIRCPIYQLTPKMLRMPEPESDDDMAKRLIEHFKASGMKPKEAKVTVEKIIKSGEIETLADAQRRLGGKYAGRLTKAESIPTNGKPRFLRMFVEPSLGKGGLVRDWALRRIIRDCLQREGVSLDSFNEKKLKELADAGKFYMPSGVPIKSVISIGVINGPITIPVRDPLTGQQATNSRTHEPLFRYHISRNNHHVEIMADRESSEWSLRNGECVTVYEATLRVRSSITRIPRADGENSRGKRPKSFAAQSAVDRSNTPTQTFVMSLSEGEMIRARRKDRPDETYGYYVVVKLDDKRIYFAPHNDARNADEQDRWDVTYADLSACGIDPGQPPCKVRVTPLGDSVVQND